MPQVQAHDPDTARVIELGRGVIAAEAEALWSLARLDESFSCAIDLIARTNGRMVVCGQGKSGHIARKLAATFLATGTAACFLHAGEAAHGDLGMLRRGDTLLILSKSGDAREFGAVIRHATALGVPIIAMTSNRESQVAASARTVLLLPAKAEACPFGSSPTTSTTMMLALGDALAMTLLHVRGLTAADLLAWHPGGRLGFDLLPVATFMHRGDALPIVAVDTPFAEVIATISDRGFGIAGVADPCRRLLGVITDGDIRRHLLTLPHAVAGDVMSGDPWTLPAGALARDALTMMTEARITALFVLEPAAGGRIIGLVHLHDLLRRGVG